ncbi:hypothetical protein B0T10DRAFT_495776 [Thelonectria olida]|uniref:Uncharacterized protein n=1 Tax=Thelonectria olida TaxID=1576542 RepID=A0A9P9AK12_9HYPO|nr:hypothetical protein B0T10DRAFT_495776 [Thelonectria olida]
MNFGLTGDGSGSSSGWLGFGRSRRNEGTSPGTTSPPPHSAIAGSPNAFGADDTSFAASYHPEASPLFNPSLPLQPRSEAPETSLFGRSPHGNQHSVWGYQSAHAESSNRQSSPLATNAGALSPELSTDDHIHTAYTASQQGVTQQQTDEQDTDEQGATSQDSEEGATNHDIDNQFKDGQKAVDEAAGDNTGEEVPNDEDAISQHAETSKETIEIVAGRREPDAQEHVDEQDLNPLEPEVSEETVVVVEETHIQLKATIVAEATDEDMEDVAAPAPQDVPASVVRLGELGTEPAEKSKSPTPNALAESSSEDEIPNTTQLAQEAERSAPGPRRSRRSGADMLNEAAESLIKDLEGPRKRFSMLPPPPVVNPASAAKRARKSMPARVDAQTPKKRGRPRKSDAAATPATASQSAKKRGRPRKSDGLSAPSSAVKQRPGPIPRRTTSIKDSGAVSETPKTRGRPPKNTPQASSTKPIASESTGAGVAPTRKSGRSVRPRAVSSPAKRGRPARKAATVSKPAATKAAKAPKTTATRGRPAAAKPAAEVTTVDTATEPPKRRGRPAKAVVAEVGEPKAKETTTKPATKQRGRPAAVVEETPVPAPTRRGRSAPSKPAEAAAPATKKRGRAKQSAPEPAPAAEPEPPAKRQRTTRKAAQLPDPAPAAAPAKKRGRPAAKKASEEPVTKEVAIEAPKTRTRGRAAKSSVEKTVEEPAQEPEKPAPKRSGRAAKSGKGEIPSAKAVAEEAAPKAKRGRAAAPTRVEKKKAPAAPTARRSTRARG